MAAADRAARARRRRCARPFRRRRPPGRAAADPAAAPRTDRRSADGAPGHRRLRALAPDAAIDLVVGSWNGDARRAPIPAVDASGNARRALARARGRRAGTCLAASRGAAVARAPATIWPSTSSRTSAATCSPPASGAAWTAGYRSGGGGALLDVALDYDHARAHHRQRTAARVGRARRTRAGAADAAGWAIADGLRRSSRTRLRRARRDALAAATREDRWSACTSAAGARSSSGSRNGSRRSRAGWSRSLGATIVLTGSAADRSLDRHRERRRCRRHASSTSSGDVDLLTLAALLERLDLLVTGDTGPMHLAGAVGTPIVAVFGPSDPARYAPRGPLTASCASTSLQPVQPDPPARPRAASATRPTVWLSVAATASSPPRWPSSSRGGAPPSTPTPRPHDGRGTRRSGHRSSKRHRPAPRAAARLPRRGR